MFDLKITGGTVVDGTGADRLLGDVAVRDGRIVEVRRRGPGDPTLAGEAAETIDATGRSSRPASWTSTPTTTARSAGTSLLEPSSNHGVTTVVTGNCGVGFAPVRPGQEQWLIELMEGVEDIPGTALTEGITWGWETYAEYLDVIGRRELAVDMGSQVAHGTVRAYAMGERGARNEAGHPRGHRGDEPVGARGGRGGGARLLVVAHAGAPRHGRRTRARYLRRRRRTVRARPGDGRRRRRRCSNWRRRARRARTSSHPRRNSSGCGDSAARSTAR